MPTVRELNPQLYETLEERGEASVRADYEVNQVYGAGTRPLVRMWMLEKDANRQNLADDREERMVAAAEKSAEATLWATRAACVSAFLAAIAILVSVAGLFQK